MLDYVVRLAEMGGISALLAELDQQVLSPRQLVRPAAPPGGLAEIEKRAAAAFAAERWQDALVWYGELCRTADPGVDWRKVLLALGRCLLYLDDHLGALAVLERLAPLQPLDFDAQFYLGRARQLLHRYGPAIEALSRANLLRPGTHKCLVALAQSCHMGLSGGYGVVDPLPADGGHADLAAIAYRAAIAASPKDRTAYLGLARLLAEQGRVEEALSVLEQGVKAKAPKRPLVEEAVLVALHAGRLDLAPALVKELRACAPKHPLLGRMGRMLRELDEPQRKLPAGPPALLLLSAGHGLGTLSALLTKATITARPDDSCSAIEAALRVLDDELVGVGGPAALGQAAAAWPSLAGHLRGDVAGVRYGDPSRAGSQGILWRRAALLKRLARVPGDRPFAAAYPEIAADARLAALPTRAGRGAPVLDRPPATVALVSRNGADRFGGGEHFLHEAAAFYAAQGCRTLFVGLGKVPQPVASREAGVLAYTVPDDPLALRSVLRREKVDLVHALSGLGHLCAEAVGDDPIRLVYGIHHWRELLQSPANHEFYFPYVTARTPVHPGFQAILRRADLVYANSAHVAELCQRQLGLLPIEIPSLVDDGFGQGPEDPGDPDVARARELGQGFMLLVNARADKGFTFLLEVAALLPEVRFVAIAGQSSWDTALCLLAERGLRNVRLARRFASMAPLYRRARAVLVPSFRFVETFSRAVVEAQRLGVPVIGADAGNVPGLLARSGVALGQDPVAWAAEIRRLVADPGYHRTRSEASARAGRLMSSRRQAEGFGRLLGALSRRILVAVGAGVGNICHTTPLVRRLAEHYGAPVDVLVNGDFPGCSSLFRGAPWVASVYERPDHALTRTYDLAVITHSFGRLLPPLSARHLLGAREVAPFDPTTGEHEVDANLRLLERGLGIPVRPEDRRGYFLGQHRYRYPRARRIALHAGCKGGVYLVKRWPHFAELAAALGAAGYSVISVGTEDEHVPGTIRAVGGTIEDTVRELLGCDALISNDSGVMNLGNALGMPVVAFFGPSSARVRGPVNAPCLTFQAPLACSPCEESPRLRHRFTEGSCTCIGRIALEDVLEPIKAFLAAQEAAHAGLPADDPVEPLRRAA